MDYNGKNVPTTYDIEVRFLGKYSGRKTGFLELKGDGTGSYKYDIFGFGLPGCTSAPIELEWGFLLDEKGEVVRFDREYGYSYPLLLKSTGANSFQGCRKQIMLDFIIEQKNTLSISSSDDWVK